MAFIYRPVKTPFKYILLHDGNKLDSVPIAHSAKVKEIYHTMSLVFNKINDNKHNGVICVDIMMVMMGSLLAQQRGYTKYL